MENELFYKNKPEKFVSKLFSLVFHCLRAISLAAFEAKIGEPYTKAIAVCEQIA
jgi:hypothetical protein